MPSNVGGRGGGLPEGRLRVRYWGTPWFPRPLLAPEGPPARICLSRGTRRSRGKTLRTGPLVLRSAARLQTEVLLRGGAGRRLDRSGNGHSRESSLNDSSDPTNDREHEP